MKEKLVSAVVAYDAKQARKRSYNRFALGIYLQAVDSVMEDIESGLTPRQAILQNFNDRLLDHCMKAVGESIPSDQELRSEDARYFRSISL